MTGAPIQNYLDDFYSFFDFLRINIAKVTDTKKMNASSRAVDWLRQDIQNLELILEQRFYVFIYFLSKRCCTRGISKIQAKLVIVLYITAEQMKFC